MDTQIRGSGVLAVGVDRGPCDYRLTLWADAPDRGDGWLNEGADLLILAAKAGTAVLTLDDGRAYDIRVLGVVDGVARVSFALS